MSAPVVERTPSPSVPPATANGAPGGGAVGFNGIRRVPPAVNEPVRGYAAGSAERVALKAKLHAMAAERIEIPIVIGGREYRTGEMAQAVMPHAHAHVLADWHKASEKHVEMAIQAALDAQREWARWPW